MQPRKTEDGAQSAGKDDPAQSKRFEEAARELDADETGEAFERALGVVVPPVPAPKEPAKR